MNKEIQAIIIDPAKGTVTAGAVSDLDSYQKLVGGHIDVVKGLFVNGDELYVNDEGLYIPDVQFFMLKGASQPYAGVGIVVGAIDSDGENTDVKSTVNEVLSRMVSEQVTYEV